jgi:pyruvate kinase
VEVLGKPAEYEEDEVGYQPAQIGCSLPAVFRDAKPGERIFFDDGKIEGVIRAVHKEGVEPRLEVKITNAVNGTAKLRAEKGINLPDTKLRISPLTAKDLEDLEFATKYGDLVSLSFVRRPEDVTELVRELDRLGATQTGIILKIENRAAVEALPRILLTAMGRPITAVMVARGDLGVEIGFERMAEIQEEILWICEAAHVPVIWATQVLESLVKRGLPSRAEVTDAAMSGRAECVMLNKGPHILLDSIFFATCSAVWRAIRPRNPLSCAGLASQKWLGNSVSACVISKRLTLSGFSADADSNLQHPGKDDDLCVWDEKIIGRITHIPGKRAK